MECFPKLCLREAMQNRRNIYIYNKNTTQKDEIENIKTLKAKEK